MLAAPHYPQGNHGSIVRLDTKKDIRTCEPMTYVTPYVDVRGEGVAPPRQFRGPMGAAPPGR